MFCAADVVRELKQKHYVKWRIGYGAYFFSLSVELKSVKCFFGKLHHHEDYSDTGPFSKIQFD